MSNNVYHIAILAFICLILNSCSRKKAIEKSTQFYPQLMYCEEILIEEQGSGPKFKIYWIECESLGNSFGTVYLGLKYNDSCFVVNLCDSVELQGIYNYFEEMVHSSKVETEINLAIKEILEENNRRSKMNKF